MYVDGTLNNSGVANLTLSATGPIALGAYAQPGGAINMSSFASLTMGRVRIHSGILTLAQIQSNYALELCTFSSQGTVSTECNAPEAINFVIGSVTVVTTTSSLNASSTPSASGLYTICYEPNGSSLWQTSFRL